MSCAELNPGRERPLVEPPADMLIKSGVQVAVDKDRHRKEDANIGGTKQGVPGEPPIPS